jgi:dephospho-CoA kinase
MNKIVIGITGTLGAGKGTVVDYLVKEGNFKHYSVRGFLTKEIEDRNMPLNRDSMVLVANELRKNNSPSYIVDCLLKRAKHSDSNIIIESIRTPGEIESLREKSSNFYVIAVDADQKTRFNRIKKRKSETDYIDYQTFIENEKREMTSDDPNHQNLKKCGEMADYMLTNDDSIEVLTDKISEILKEIN